MSSTYNLEPPPTAKVLLQTTSGDVELELFAKQTPLASRNFLQLCLDGYYNGTIFHRVVPGFVLQGGDPTGTGNGGEATYPGGTFADEFHSRLKFNRRGLLGMANSGAKDDNGSQFFLTLGKADELNNHNTMFGRVVGDTIFNVVKMGEAELVDMPGSERPLYPTKITGAEILVNPYSGMLKRELRPKALPENSKTLEKKKSKKKAGKAFLSFAEGDGDADAPEPAFKRAKFNSKFIEPSEPQAISESKDSAPLERKAKPARKRASRSPTPPVKEPREPKAQLPLPDEETPSRSASSTPESEQVTRVSSILEKTNAQIAELKASMKRTTAPVAAESTRKRSALEEMIPAHAIRGRKRKQGNRDNGTSDSRALEMFKAFQSKLEGAAEREPKLESAEPVKQNADDGEDEETLCDLHFIVNCASCQAFSEDRPDSDAEEDDGGWMSHKLNFEKDRLGKDLSWKQKNEDDLVVIDPREKAKDLRDEQKARQGGKSSKRAWDIDRDKGRLPERLSGR